MSRADGTYQPGVYRRQGGNVLVVTTDGSIEKEGVPQKVSWTVGAEASDARTLTATVQDSDGNTITGVNVPMYIALLKDAAGSGFTTASTAMAALTTGAAGNMTTITAQKLFFGISSTSGTLVLTWTDTSAQVAYIGAALFENSKWQISTGAITCAS